MLDKGRISVFSFNVAKNYAYVDVLLENCKDVYDVLFIQEPPRQVIRMAPSTTSVAGDVVVGAPKHPAWTTMVRPSVGDSHPRVLAYISNRLAPLRPSMRRDILDHRDIFVLSLTYGPKTMLLMNIYNNNQNTALRFIC